jgi:hypothetical protein
MHIHQCSSTCANSQPKPNTPFNIYLYFYLLIFIKKPKIQKATTRFSDCLTGVETYKPNRTRSRRYGAKIKNQRGDSRRDEILALAAPRIDRMRERVFANWLMEAERAVSSLYVIDGILNLGDVPST